MALTILTDGKAMERAMGELKSAFEQIAEDVPNIAVKWPGKWKASDVYWVASHGIWFLPLHHKRDGSYLWLFGVQDAKKKKQLIPSCLVTLPVSRASTSALGVLGAIAQDETGQLFLALRRKMGGRVPNKFWDNYVGDKQKVVDGDGNQADMFLIGCLESREIVSKIASFVHEYTRSKSVAKKPRRKSN